MQLEEYTSIVSIDSLTVSELKYKFDERLTKAKENSTFYFRYTPEFDSVNFTKAEKSLSVDFPFLFLASTENPETGKEKDNTIFFNLSVIFSLELTTQKTLKISDTLKDEIVRNFLPRILQPYFRQIVSEMLVKSGLPPLQLPVYQGVIRKNKGKKA